MLAVEPFKQFFTAFANRKVPSSGPFREFLLKSAYVPENYLDDCMQHILNDVSRCRGSCGG